MKCYVVHPKLLLFDDYVSSKRNCQKLFLKNNQCIHQMLLHKEAACQSRICKTHGFNPSVREIPWRRAWQPHSSVLSRRIPWTEKPGRPTVCGVAKNQTWLNDLAPTYYRTQEYALEKEMATHSSILAWKVPWMEEPSGLHPMGSQRVGHDWAANTPPY